MRGSVSPPHLCSEGAYTVLGDQVQRRPDVHLGMREPAPAGVGGGRLRVRGTGGIHSTWCPPQGGNTVLYLIGPIGGPRASRQRL